MCEVEVVMGVHMKVGLMECEAAPPSAWGGGGQITNRRCVRGCQTARCHVDEDSSLSGNWCCVETLGLCTVSILRIMYRM